MSSPALERNSLLSDNGSPMKRQRDPAHSPDFLRDSQEFAASGTRVPRRVLRLLREHGADVTREAGLTLVIMPATGGAQDVYKGFIASLSEDDDPLLSVHACANAAVDAEASSILAHYQTLRASDFDFGALPPLPAVSPHIGVVERYHHATRALSAVGARIADPQSLAYPAIRALPSGALVCRLYTCWAGGTLITLPIHRP